MAARVDLDDWGREGRRRRRRLQLLSRVRNAGPVGLPATKKRRSRLDRHIFNTNVIQGSSVAGQLVQFHLEASFHYQAVHVLFPTTKNYSVFCVLGINAGRKGVESFHTEVLTPYFTRRSPLRAVGVWTTLAKLRQFFEVREYHSCSI